MLSLVLLFSRYSGVASIEAKVPDTITSWIATAFAVHPESGLGLSETPAQVCQAVVTRY